MNKRSEEASDSKICRTYKGYGILAWTLEEKEDAYKAPYYSIMSQLFEDGEAWKKLKLLNN